MLRGYANEKPGYGFKSVHTEPMTDTDNLTFLTMKIGFAGLSAMLLMSLVLFCVMAFA